MQGSEQEASRLFNEVMRGCVRAGLLRVMAEEVDLLCGPKHHPATESSYRRAGSEHGQAYIEGQREGIIRPRVREKDGTEIRLASYEAASSPKRIFDEVVASLEQGLAIRGAARAKGKSSLSKSEASRMWVERSQEILTEFRGRSLAQKDWIALWIDGVFLHKNLCVVVAVGVDIEGNKQVLDFEEGPSENATVVSALFARLKERGFEEPEERRLLVCRDGSAALAKGVTSHWPSAVQQECLVHCQRELRDKVRSRDRAEVDGLFKTLRNSQGKEAGEEAFDELLDFVSERNAAAGQALERRRDQLLAFHRLEVPSTLNTTFLNTNIIENTLRNWREATGNVKRWQEKEDMVSRWMASGLMWAEVGFRKVRGHEELAELREALKRPDVMTEVEPGAAAPDPAKLSQLDRPAASPERVPNTTLKSKEN